MAIINAKFLLAAILTVPLLSASTFTTFQVISSDPAGEAVKATATFDFSAFSSSKTIGVTLQNLVTNEISVGQAISGVSFQLSGLTGKAAIRSSNGTLITVDSLGNFSTGVSSALTAWTTSTSLTDITASALGSGQPDQTILGAPTASGSYASANASIAGNDPHNPFVEQTATFTFADLAGVTLDSIVSSVRIGFGTSGADYIAATAVSSAVPEPSTFMLAGFAIALVAGLKRRR